MGILAPFPLSFHIVVALLVVWITGYFKINFFFPFTLSMVYLYEVNRRQQMALIQRIRFEENVSKHRNRYFDDSETAQWINRTTENIWNVFLERLISKTIAPSIAPWFLDTYKPWQIKHAELLSLHLGKTPPVITSVKSYAASSMKNITIIEFDVSFVSSDDMHAIIEGTPRYRIGLGMSGTCHISKVQLEGKVKLGIHYTENFPFISKIHMGFTSLPFLSMKISPMMKSKHLNVSNLPIISNFINNLIFKVLEETVVCPNLIVIDVKKLINFFISSPSNVIFNSIESAFKKQKEKKRKKIGYIMLEIIKAENLVIADRNGLSDPYVRGKFGNYHFCTKVKRKTLNPEWRQKFYIPIFDANCDALIKLYVLDKDMFKSDKLGNCQIDVKGLKKDEANILWLSLNDAESGRLNVSVSIIDRKKGSPNLEVPVPSQVKNENPSEANVELSKKTVEKNDAVELDQKNFRHTTRDELNASSNKVATSKIGDNETNLDINANPNMNNPPRNETCYVMDDPDDATVSEQPFENHDFRNNNDDVCFIDENGDNVDEDDGCKSNDPASVTFHSNVVETEEKNTNARRENVSNDTISSNYNSDNMIGYSSHKETEHEVTDGEKTVKDRVNKNAINTMNLEKEKQWEVVNESVKVEREQATGKQESAREKKRINQKEYYEMKTGITDEPKRIHFSTIFQELFHPPKGQKFSRRKKNLFHRSVGKNWSKIMGEDKSNTTRVQEFKGSDFESGDPSFDSDYEIINEAMKKELGHVNEGKTENMGEEKKMDLECVKKVENKVLEDEIRIETKSKTSQRDDKHNIASHFNDAESESTCVISDDDGDELGSDVRGMYVDEKIFISVPFISEKFMYILKPDARKRSPSPPP